MDDIKKGFIKEATKALEQEYPYASSGKLYQYAEQRWENWVENFVKTEIFKIFYSGGKNGL